MTAELFEEEGNTALDALIAKVSEPTEVGGTCARLAFAAGDQPLNTIEIQRIEWAQEWFGRCETNARGHLP
jgi:hypothetical protein